MNVERSWLFSIVYQYLWIFIFFLSSEFLIGSFLIGKESHMEVFPLRTVTFDILLNTFD